MSTATVSRALASPDAVSEATRERVLAAVRETGYTPNVAARSLRQARSMMVLVVIPSLITPFFSELVYFIDRALAARGYGLLVGDLVDRAEQEPRLVGLAASGQVDGLILLNGEVLGDGGRRVDEMGVPIVSLGVPAEGDIPAVLVDDRAGGAAVARHFLAEGHTTFAYVSGRKGNHCDTERWAGFRETLADAGVDPADLLRIEASFQAAAGEAAGQTFAALAERPTAVFCAGDVMAMGFMHAVHEAGIRVPQDISVVGFDGIDLGRYFSPALTSVVQPREAMGRAAAETLLALMDGSQGQPAARTVLPVTMRIGLSTGPPAGAAP